jgi:DNA-binding NarL/FixJ family response regulator
MTELTRSSLPASGDDPTLVRVKTDGGVVGVGLGPRNRIHESDRQAVLDAAATLQLRRSEIAARVARGELSEVVVARTADAIHHWMRTSAPTWRELHSIRPAATPTQLRASLPVNRRLLDRGHSMVSIFGADGVDPEARMLLAYEPVGSYLLSVAPVQMKIVDRSSVLLGGPTIDGHITLMSVTSPPVLDAAWRYWYAALACSFPVGDRVGQLEDLTPRQHRVIALMASGVGDEAIAEALEVSVRTVRSDVAAILEALGVKTRFAAGVRLHALALVD